MNEPARQRPSDDRRPEAWPPGALNYVLVRITGILLAVLALGHFAVTHIVNDVASTDASFVAERWRSAVVLGWDWLMLASAVLHGSIGLRTIIGEQVRSAAVARLGRLTLYLVAVAMLTAGTITLVGAVVRV